MQQIWIRKNGAPDVLSFEDSTEPSSLESNEALIDVHYSGINFADVIMRQGLYRDAPPKPFVPGYEVSGIVTQVGSGVRRFKVGDPVVTGCLFGGYSSQIKAPEDLMFKQPAHLSLAESAGLAVNWITAHAALVDMGRVRAGDRIVVDAATGGVGTIALQMLNHLGAQTIGLTSSPAKLDYIRSLGADAMTHHEFESQPSLGGFDLILNTQGGKTIRQHYDRLGMTGRVIALGFSSGIRAGGGSLVTFIKEGIRFPKFSIVKMFNLNRGVYALNALTLLRDPQYRATLASKWDEAEKYKLLPHIDHIFPARDIAKAHAHLESRKARGKVLIQWK